MRNRMTTNMFTRCMNLNTLEMYASLQQIINIQLCHSARQALDIFSQMNFAPCVTTADKFHGKKNQIFRMRMILAAICMTLTIKPICLFEATIHTHTARQTDRLAYLQKRQLFAIDYVMTCYRTCNVKKKKKMHHTSTTEHRTREHHLISSAIKKTKPMKNCCFVQSHSTNYIRIYCKTDSTWIHNIRKENWGNRKMEF